MKYQHIVEAVFIERPNRFIAYCMVEGKKQKVHVKNTGRCRELLVQGATVYLEESDNPKRKTRYSLIAVQKGERLINMDSQAPNEVVDQALKQGKIMLPGVMGPLIMVRREVSFKDSRFDFYAETETDRIFIEVKGVTLEEAGVVRFPDAPTARGLKHLEELMAARKEGYKAFVIFVVQMEQARYFAPCHVIHSEFASTLEQAAQSGVGVLAYTCHVEKDELMIKEPLEVRLKE